MSTLSRLGSSRATRRGAGSWVLVGAETSGVGARRGRLGPAVCADVWDVDSDRTCLPRRCGPVVVEVEGCDGWTAVTERVSLWVERVD